ncbi:hypothetical protein Z969_08505 [Clostridium novyi A str. 4570]|uniref:DUF7922 domain-containing protein n=1 Tax=Clostridium novyi A str. 4570 TaxID=1444290 RepID=A0AA89CLX7_CLONO|nr:hypothetical protein [Clostridium novyi]KGN01471.1 hypothetical protein Z969_08505 [Clostridium novyi A str. 4570]
MTAKRNYSRYFIILQEDEKGYSVDPNKCPTGYAKVERKNNKCKVSYYVQNLKKSNEAYCMVLICDRKKDKRLVKVGEINIDAYGRAEVSYEYDINNIANCNIPMDNIKGASIVRIKDSNVHGILTGFVSGAKLDDWKSYVVIEGESRCKKEEEEVKEEIKKEAEVKAETKVDVEVEVESQENIFDKYENDIEKHKESEEEVKQELREIKEELPEEENKKEENVELEIKESANIEVEAKESESIKAEVNEAETRQAEVVEELEDIEKKENKIEENIEEIKEPVEKVEEIKEKASDDNLRDDKQEDKEENIISDIKEKVEEEKEIEVEEDLEVAQNMQVDENDTRRCDCDCDWDCECDCEDKKKSKDKKEEKKKDKEKEKEKQKEKEKAKEKEKEKEKEKDKKKDKDKKDKCPYEEYCHMNWEKEYYKHIVEGLKEEKGICEELGKCHWYKIDYMDLMQMKPGMDFSKYSMIYYPMINYISYIMRKGHYLMGFKYDKEGKMKYLVYGIPGTKSIVDQPFNGATGFVTWVPEHGKDNNNNNGYWVMFYDFKRCTVVIPVKK